MKRKEVGSRVLFCCKRDLGYKSTIFYAAACVAKVDAAHVRPSVSDEWRVPPLNGARASPYLRRAHFLRRVRRAQNRARFGCRAEMTAMNRCAAAAAISLFDVLEP